MEKGREVRRKMRTIRRRRRGRRSRHSRSRSLRCLCFHPIANFPPCIHSSLPFRGPE